jgi:hypothetical protein
MSGRVKGLIGVGWLKHPLIPWQEVSWVTGKGMSEGKRGEVRRFGVQEKGSEREKIGCREEVQGLIGVEWLKHPLIPWQEVSLVLR